ncbi:hypothetical protein GF374_01820 [Candidatus Woesearchaeota archaeon]|nr:hypothetical protein [Candidatus Woesearchaeota archaeon]
MVARLDTKHEQLMQIAKKEIEVADHLLYMTYPMIKETKFLLAIAGHIITASRAALQSLLEYERYYKQIEAYPKNFAMEISIYRQKLEEKYKFDPKYYRLLGKLLEVYKYDKNGTMRFRRGNKYILTSHDYDTATLDLNSVKRYSSVTRKFVNDIKAVIKNE